MVRFVSCLVVILLTVVTALPDGAPFCIVGAPSMNSIHMTPAFNNNGNNSVTSGTIATGGYALIIDGTVLDPAVTHTIQTNTIYTVLVKGLANQQFKGMQLILAAGSGANLSGALIPTLNDTLNGISEPAIGCERTAQSGVSHSEISIKSNLTATLKLDTVQPNLTMDLNIVVTLNRQQGSEYYYSQYKLASVAAPTKAPTKTPSKAPTQAPVPPMAPVTPTGAAPTAPVAAPTAPVAAPKPQKRCGLFRLGIVCPLTRCGVLGRALGLCQDNQ